MSKFTIKATFGALLLSALGMGIPPAPYDRGAWLWQAAQTPPSPKLLESLRQWRIRRLYLSFPLSKLSENKEAIRWQQALRERQISSWLLLSNNAWAKADKRAELLKAVSDSLVAFNVRHPPLRFSGLALDIEPHSEPEWRRLPKTQKIEILLGAEWKSEAALFRAIERVETEFQRGLDLQSLNLLNR